QLFHQLQEPLHRTSGFDPHPSRTWESRVKLSHRIALVPQRLFDYLARLDVQNSSRLLSRMDVHAYNLHLGLLGSELCRVNTAKFTRTVRRPSSLCHQGLSPPISV